jgi:adenosylhomocysteine nucleosidase
VTRRVIAILALVLAWAPMARTAEPATLIDPTPRTAVISAFGPELFALSQAVEGRRSYQVGGTEFITGTLEGRPVVLFLSGVSMVNAAMTTQSALDRFRITRIVFSGIAGGVDPRLDVGDVVVADQWGEYLESTMAREIAPGRFEAPAGANTTGAPFGMMYPGPAQVARHVGQLERRAWFPADPQLIAVARTVAAKVALKRCTSGGQCLSHAPQVVVGGNGVSGQSFVDNAALRSWAYATFQARVLDMETAAVAHVAYADDVPFIGFRSLSDLAGGDPGKNQAGVFFQLASDNSAAVVRAFVKALP